MSFATHEHKLKRWGSNDIKRPERDVIRRLHELLKLNRSEMEELHPSSK